MFFRVRKNEYLGPEFYVPSAIFFVSMIILFWFLERAAVSTPFKDELYFSSVYEAALNKYIPLKEFFIPHLGHQYFLVKLLLWIVVRFGLSLKWLMALNATCMALSASICSRLLFDLFDKDPYKTPLFYFYQLTFALGFCGLQNWENLYWSIQVSIGYIGLALCLGVFLLVAAYMKYYNLDRLHTANGGISPINFELSQKKVSGLS